MTTPLLQADLIRDEGEVLRAYQDGGGVWTIGVGHTGAGVRRGVVITQVQSRALLAQDIAKAEKGLDAKLPFWRKMNDARQDVMVNMCFNLGIEGLCSFHHMIAAETIDEYALASADMLATEPWHSQIGQRCNRLAEQMKTGVRYSATA